MVVSDNIPWTSAARLESNALLYLLKMPKPRTRPLSHLLRHPPFPLPPPSCVTSVGYNILRVQCSILTVLPVLIVSATRTILDRTQVPTVEKSRVMLSFIMEVICKRDVLQSTLGTTDVVQFSLDVPPLKTLS
uniref:Uncharacterized protein n=1 Tax=Cacopsylla melanoneura TaxID=428564 RepID=A0A8D9AMU0_9HEMI